MISLKSEREIQHIREACDILKVIFETVEPNVRPGVTTLELDQMAEKIIRKAGAVPAFKGYRGFPGTICASVNHEVVHGIPSRRKLKEGDLFSIDVGCVINGFYGDAARTYPVGKVSSEALMLAQAVEGSFWAGIEGKKAGNRIGDIGADVQAYAEKQGFGVVRDFVGHGIGRALHEDPQVPNFGKPGSGLKIEKGLALAIEPMITEGSWRVEILEDGWTAVTVDGSLSAHHEETVIVYEDRIEVLTACQKKTQLK